MDIKEYKQEPTADMMALLLTADPNETEVKSYFSKARKLICIDQGHCVGIAVLTFKNDVYELKNIAVDEAYQGQGIAKNLIAEVKSFAKRLGASSIEVGTGNSSLDQLALYQKCGFRMHRIERDFFKTYPEPIYENGMRCIDMVYLRASL